MEILKDVVLGNWLWVALLKQGCWTRLQRFLPTSIPLGNQGIGVVLHTSTVTVGPRPPSPLGWLSGKVSWPALSAVAPCTATTAPSSSLNPTGKLWDTAGPSVDRSSPRPGRLLPSQARRCRQPQLPSRRRAGRSAAGPQCPPSAAGRRCREAPPVMPRPIGEAVPPSPEAFPGDGRPGPAAPSGRRLRHSGHCYGAHPHH